VRADPGRIAAQLPVDLPAERGLETKRTPEFLSLRSSVEDLVRAQHPAYYLSPTALKNV
jgi:NitT/TauT family transport system ATP-binding protein